MFKLNRPLMIAVAVGLFASTSYAEIVTIRTASETASESEVVLWVEGVKWRIDKFNAGKPGVVYDTMDQACAVAAGLLPDGSAPAGYYDITGPSNFRYKNPKGIYTPNFGWACQYDQIRPSYRRMIFYQNWALPSTQCFRDARSLVPAYLDTYADRIPCKHHSSYKPQ